MASKSPAWLRVMSPILRLARYGFPHRAPLVGAVVAMVVYAGASGALAYMFKPIFDEVLPTQTGLGLVTAAIIGFSVFKGIGAYFSVYLNDLLQLHTIN